MNCRTGMAPLRKIVPAVVAILLLGGTAERGLTQSARQDQVLKFQKEFQDNCVAADVDRIGAVMRDDAIFIHGNGAIQGKTDFLASIKNGQLSLSGYELTDAQVILFDGGAIVTGLENLTFKPPAGSNAPPRVIHMRGSAVWIHTASAWKLVLDQDTTLAAMPVSR
jgi:ketosteroid isomerase-like protein